jgi:hypothetical protein
MHAPQQRFNGGGLNERGVTKQNHHITAVRGNVGERLLQGVASATLLVLGDIGYVGTTLSSNG